MFNRENAVGDVGNLGREDDHVRGSEGESGVPTFDAGTSVLVLASGGARDVDRALLSPERAGSGFLAIGVTSDPGRVVERHHDRHEASPGPCAVIRVGPAAGHGGPTDATVERIDEPANLTGLGTTVMRAIEGWEPGWQAWFDSLGPLVHHAGVGKLCQFTDVFAGRLAREGATTFVRLDPAIHDERTVHRVMGAFDAAVWDRREETGEDWRVRRR